jgi:hypothetical protein
MKPGILAWAIMIWACLHPWPALACRYNVRDVGFVELETEPYHLYWFLHEGTPVDLVSTLEEMSGAALGASNIRLELINVDQQKDHPALKHISSLDASAAWPVAALVSPDGQSLVVSLAQASQPFRERIGAALASVTRSQKRQEIMRAVSQAFGVVLLIEGRDTEGNSRARQSIAGAIEEIRTQMRLMPKAIAQPPVMIVLEAAALAQERVLLWSLGLDTVIAHPPRAAVLYGKARWIGPVMKGAEISVENLAGILSIIGADCECSLDISWTQGTRLPVRWDDSLHTDLTRALGFDPENPMVKIEVSRILGRRGSSRTASLGYRELALETPAPWTPTAATPRTPAHDTMGTAKSPPTGRPAGSGPVLAEGGSVVRVSILVVAGLAVIVVSASLVLFLQVAKRRRN